MQNIDGMNIADHFDFGIALCLLKRGQRVRRAGWNGKGMWLALTRGSCISHAQARAGAAQHLAEEQAATDAFGAVIDTTNAIVIGAHIDMRAADGSLVIGWLASQTDMLATDWEVVS